MNIMLHYIQFTVYVVISAELNLGCNKETHNHYELTNYSLSLRRESHCCILDTVLFTSLLKCCVL